WVHVLLLQLNSGIKFTSARSLQQCLIICWSENSALGYPPPREYRQQQASLT
ncbi:hypothetical protein ACZ87_02234, partial [Candidatus Erwinia dacicola]